MWSKIRKSGESGFATFRSVFSVVKSSRAWETKETRPVQGVINDNIINKNDKGGLNDYATKKFGFIKLNKWLKK